jgi:hypothetical protein
MEKMAEIGNLQFVVGTEPQLATLNDPPPRTSTGESDAFLYLDEPTGTRFAAICHPLCPGLLTVSLPPLSLFRPVRATRSFFISEQVHQRLRGLGLELN